ncbi:VOC family protein [Hydrogenophaga sp.]|uniref:VOC family protein n=1 Tax=Hydrogenophaga sp. TaxID=1904254 RepID=UPI003569A610
MNATNAALDHLVIAATTLEEGVAWCENTLGVTPGPGGEHPLMGTHNRLLALTVPGGARAYLEIIAIQASAKPTRASGLKRWFDLDDLALRERLVRQGPSLIHWVLGVPNIATACARLAAQGLDRGSVLRASRATPAGLLEWQISVRDDGQRLLGGCLPTLIQWGAVHPLHTMPNSGLALQAFELATPEPAALNTALAALGAQALATVRTGPAALRATLATPRGTVVLTSGEH